ncbi:MAG: M20/M25/M40 family metallo-hydrolase, partial [Tannerella sp.]|nr:M20/M25/M40 family metallo-hydrolase [Tannerella sp.]
QLMIQLKGFQTALREGLVRCNVKFIVEGEEEIGSASLEPFCEAHRDLLRADVILVSDTSMYSEEAPSLTTGLRGLSYWEVEVTGPNRDLHSGHFGGAVANPVNVLCRLLADVTDADGRIAIPHFYDDVQELSPEEKEMMAQAPFDEAKYRQAIGVEALAGEAGYSTLERNSCRPSFDICGIRGGYTGEGAKTVLPSKAYAKISCRLVPHQDAARITQLVMDWLTAAAPDGVKLRVTHCHSGQAYVCPIDLPAYRAAERAFTVAFGKKPLAMRRGGSIPIVPAFERMLGVKTVLMGFGLERHAIHSPNENFGLERFYTGIEAVAEFYRNWK